MREDSSNPVQSRRLTRADIECPHCGKGFPAIVEAETKLTPDPGVRTRVDIAIGIKGFRSVELAESEAKQ